MQYFLFCRGCLHLTHIDEVVQVQLSVTHTSGTTLTVSVLPARCPHQKTNHSTQMAVQTHRSASEMVRRRVVSPHLYSDLQQVTKAMSARLCMRRKQFFKTRLVISVYGFFIFRIRSFLQICFINGKTNGKMITFCLKQSFCLYIEALHRDETPVSNIDVGIQIIPVAAILKARNHSTICPYISAIHNSRWTNIDIFIHLHLFLMVLLIACVHINTPVILYLYLYLKIVDYLWHGVILQPLSLWCVMCVWLVWLCVCGLQPVLLSCWDVSMLCGILVHHILIHVIDNLYAMFGPPCNQVTNHSKNKSFLLTTFGQDKLITRQAGGICYIYYFFVLTAKSHLSSWRKNEMCASWSQESPCLSRTGC